MQLNAGRRRFLMACGAFLLLPAAARAEARLANRRAAPLRTLARWPTGGGALVPAAVRDNRLYFAGAQTAGVLEVPGGRQVWRRPVPQPCQFRPRIGGGTVVTGGKTGLSAWNEPDGAPLWSAVPDKQFGVPVIHGGRLFCGDGNRLVARDLKTGAVAWTFAAIDGTDVAYGPAAAGDAVFVGPGDGRLYALAAADGRLLWEVNRLHDWQYLRQMEVSGQVLVAGTYQEKLLGLDLASGRELWSVNGGNFINSQLIADGAAYFWSPTGWIYAVETASGRLLWRHRTTDYRGGADNWATIIAELASAGTRLFALDLDGVLHVLDREKGGETGRFRVPEPVQSFVGPVSQDKIVLGAANGDLILCEVPS